MMAATMVARRVASTVLKSAAGLAARRAASTGASMAASSADEKVGWKVERREPSWAGERVADSAVGMALL